MHTCYIKENHFYILLFIVLLTTSWTIFSSGSFGRNGDLITYTKPRKYIRGGFKPRVESLYVTMASDPFAR